MPYPMINKQQISELTSICISSFLCFIPIFSGATIINGARYLSDGILAAKFGFANTYRADVLERFEASQTLMLIAAMLASTAIAATHYLKSK